MKKSWLVCAAVLCAAPAFASGSPAAVCSACNWSGFYVGLNVGGSLGHNDATDSIVLNPPGTPGGISPGVINPINSTSHSEGLAGAIGGGQAGFNWQSGKFVLGVEADWDWSGQSDKLQVHNFLASSVVVAPSGYTQSDEHNIDWLATVRARLGVANGYSLWYLTGGGAWGRVSSDHGFQAVNATTYATAPATASFATTKGGWTFGGGVESSLAWMDADHWSAKIEYLYVDLGTIANGFSVPVTSIPTSLFTVSNASRLRNHIVRIGLNYRFGGDTFAPTPSASEPCPTCNWQGFYVGLNAGGAIGQNQARDTDVFTPSTGNAANVTNPLTDVVHSQSPAGWLFGAQAGHNWQIGQLVVGAEGDLDWSGQRDTFSNENFVASTVVVAPTQVFMSNRQKIDWLATLRARIGWADNCTLWYVTGGAAWGGIYSSHTFQAVQTIGSGILGTTTPFAANSRTTRTGWTLGGGVETSLGWMGASEHWSAKMEYLYADLGTVANTFNIPIGAAAHVYSSSNDVHEHIIRVGINYRFE